jgi:hypothetical protein
LEVSKFSGLFEHPVTSASVATSKAMVSNFVISIPFAEPNYALPVVGWLPFPTAEQVISAFTILPLLDVRQTFLGLLRLDSKCAIFL